MITAFIFDIDGTLIDSNDFHARAWEKAFAEQGKTVPYQKIRQKVGMGSDKLLPYFLSPGEIQQIGKQLSERSDEIFRRDYMMQIRPFPKVRELFKRIRESGAQIALGTSSKKQAVEEYMVIAQIRDLVQESASSDDAKESKPEPDIFHAAMKRLGNPAPKQVCVVGDTPYDATAASKAKLSCVGLLCGGFPAASLQAHGCRAIYRDPAHMLEEVETILAW